MFPPISDNVYFSGNTFRVITEKLSNGVYETSVYPATGNESEKFNFKKNVKPLEDYTRRYESEWLAREGFAEIMWRLNRDFK